MNDVLLVLHICKSLRKSCEIRFIENLARLQACWYPVSKANLTKKVDICKETRLAYDANCIIPRALEACFLVYLNLLQHVNLTKMGMTCKITPTGSAKNVWLFQDLEFQHKAC